jgi:hypothetical protein
MLTMRTASGTSVASSTVSSSANRCRGIVAYLQVRQGKARLAVSTQHQRDRILRAGPARHCGMPHTCVALMPRCRSS